MEAHHPPFVCAEFTPINQPLHSHQAQQPIQQSLSSQPSQDLGDGSHVLVGTTRNSFVADYLSRRIGGDNARFGCRAIASTRSRSDEDFYSKILPASSQISSKRALNAASNHPQKARTSCKKLVAEDMRVTKFNAKATMNMKGVEPKMPANLTITVGDDVPPNPYTIAEQKMQNSTIWKYQPNISSISSSDYHTSSSTSANASSHVPPRSFSAITDNARRQETHKSTHGQVDEMINVVQRIPNMGVIDEDISNPFRRSLPMSTSLETIPEESVSLKNSAGAAPTLDPNFLLPPSIHLDRVSSKFDWPQENPIDLTEDFYDSNTFDDVIDEDDLLSLDLPRACDAVRFFNAPRTRSTSAILPVTQASDALIQSPPLDAIADDCDQWDTVEKRKNESSDLIDIIVANAEYSPWQLAAEATQSPGSQLTLPMPVRNHTKATGSWSSLIDSPEKHALETQRPRIVRPPFPRPIRDRSPVVGISAATYLRTCFRIGEALNTGYFAVSNDGHSSSPSILMELYAKVSCSHHEETGEKQHFTFADLFHEDKPPFIRGFCPCWKGVKLWEHDCGRFLISASKSREKKLCRVIGKMERDGKEWRLMVLNIWEATWDDVEYARKLIFA